MGKTECMWRVWTGTEEQSEDLAPALAPGQEDQMPAGHEQGCQSQNCLRI